MKYDFDEYIDRNGTFAYKTDFLPEGSPADALPLWVADMDLPCAQPIIDALHARVDRRIFGYTCYDNDRIKAAVCGWFARRHGWSIEKEWQRFSPGVVTALAFLVNMLSEPGDGVVIQQPVYYPFRRIVAENGRQVLNSPLKNQNGSYVMDMPDLESKLSRPDVKGIILCSPHNPVGRVWTERELRELVSIAKKYDKWIVSDEIHCDLTRAGVLHTPLLKACPEYSDRIISCTAPSKTFNLAGMAFSSIIIPNAEYREKWDAIVSNRFAVNSCTPLGMTAAAAAYEEGDEWLEQALKYIDGNIAFVNDFVRQNMKRARVTDCQGTYLVWLDLREYGLDAPALERLMHETARLALDEGYIFGPEGAGFERINVAAPRGIVAECMERMRGALEGWSLKNCAQYKR